MIQRVQSIYLLLVVVLMSFLIFKPFAEVALQDGQVAVFYTYAIKKYITKEHSEMVIRTLPVIIMICLIGLISFMNIFQFRRRIVQMRVCIMNMLLMAGLMILMFYYYFMVKSTLLVESHMLKLPVIFPVIGIVLTLLAYRKINEDEILVRSYDRLR